MAKIIRLDVSNKEWVYECKCGETEFFILFDRPDLDTVLGFQCSNCNKVIKFEDPVLESQLAALRDENKKLHAERRRDAIDGQCALDDANNLVVRLRDENAELRKGIYAVRELIDNSSGVYGLHLNGDPAPWDSLLSGGYFESWLLDFSNAEALAGKEEK